MDGLGARLFSFLFRLNAYNILEYLERKGVIYEKSV